MSSADETFDVVVVGFGPTGALLANLLGRDGIHALVIDASTEVYTLPRAVHFDHEVMRIFQSVGLAERILPYTGPVKGSQFINAEGQVLVRIDLQDNITNQGWRSDYMFHQPSLEGVLREGALERGSVDIRLGQEMVQFEEDSDGVSILIRDTTDGSERSIRSRFLVGCDGASSTTRELAGLGMEDLDFDEPWLVVDAKVATSLEEVGFPTTPRQYCNPARPTSIIPVVGPYVRWEFMLRPGEGLEMEAPERVRELVAEWVDPDQVELIRTAVYSFHALIGNSWRKNRLFLAGDAAHQTPPFGGQGMCSGMRDATNLSWKLGLVLKGDASDALLDTYQAEREPHMRAVISRSIESGRIVCTQDPEVARTRDKWLLSSAEKPTAPPPLPGFSCGVLELEPRHPISGELGLQARVRNDAGREGLLDDIVGPGFVLLWRDEPSTLDDRSRALLDLLNVHQACIATGLSTDDTSIMALEDSQGSYQEWFDLHGLDAVLIRPDHIVYGAVTKDRDADGLLDSLAALLKSGQQSSDEAALRQTGAAASA